MAKWIEESELFFGIELPNTILKCSDCNSVQIHSDDGGGMYHKTPYCPWCGAKMEFSELKEP